MEIVIRTMSSSVGLYSSYFPESFGIFIINSLLKLNYEFIGQREVLYFGDKPYYYNGGRHEANTNYPDCILRIMLQINDLLNTSFNSVLVNLYRNEKYFIPWHSDDEDQLGDEAGPGGLPPTVSTSKSVRALVPISPNI